MSGVGSGSAAAGEGSSNLYGGVVVRLSDRLLLCQCAVPSGGASSYGSLYGGSGTSSDLAIPRGIWAEVISKCCAPNFRTSSFIALSAASNAPQVSYHIMSDENVAFAVIGEKQVQRRVAHLALDECAKVFYKMFVERPDTISESMARVFVKPYADVLQRYSGLGDADGDDKLKKVKMAIDETKQIALDNVERAVGRGQKIDDIVQATDELQFQAEGFQRSSRDLRNQLWWNNMQGKLIIGGVAAFFLLLVWFVFCGGLSCSSSSSSTTA